MRTPIVLATVIATIAMLTGAYFMVYAQNASAASLTSVKDTLSNSAPATASDHTIEFTAAGDIRNNDTDTVLIEWDDPADGFGNWGSLTLSDISVTASSVSQTLAATCGAGAEDVGVDIDSVNEDITLTICTDATAADWDAGSAIVVTVGGTNKLTNPTKTAAVGTADIYTIDITVTNAGTDTGSAQVAIIEGVTVSATIDEAVSFSINNVADTTCSGGTGDTGTPTYRDISQAADNLVEFNRDGASTAEVINGDTFYVVCQELAVSTNSSGGYSLTTESSTSLQNASDDLIDSGNCDGTCTESTGGAWATDTNNGFGYYCENKTGTDCSAALDSTSEYVNFPCTGADADCDPRTGGENPVEVMSNAGSVASSEGRIHYKLSVPGDQAAGSYSTTITYIATPTF